ncbi:putative membrane protein YfcA [Azospirillum agricola]|uniref:sulfite exporter TauE/SafE family protein n=1 Tax=Azospirillum agricola TaxID=1720247 RepID=UPI001AE48D27|nr:sulfite exporter TauE/SafE family protein [Azospirillum agricola]MBP2231814.1 putative membrane protein YfcA [Azospirillum agricola]
MDPVLWSIALGAVLAGFVQGLSGFAFSMVAMSVWAWTVEPQLAAVLAVSGGLTGQVIAALSVRRAYDLGTLLPFLLGGVVGIPLGVMLLPSLDARLFKLGLGTLLVLWCPVMLFARQLPPIRAGGRLADGVVGLIGGVMGGVGGFTGVVPTLWCSLRGLGKDTQRGVIQNFNLATLAVTMAAYVATGTLTARMLPMFAVMAPAMVIPTVLGARLYIGISEAAFRRIVLVLLTASGVALLSSAVPSLLGRA